MSLDELQACLARLYLDDPFRRLAQCDPGYALCDYVLSEEERQVIIGIDRPMLEFFARSLVSKRLGQVRPAYPSSFQLDSPRLERYFRRYHQLHPLGPRQTITQDTVGFGEFAEQCLTASEEVPPFAAELMRYERLRYRAAHSATRPSAPGPVNVSMDARPSLGRGVEVSDFRFDVADLDAELAAGRTVDTDTPPAMEHTIIFSPDSSNQGVRVVRSTAATKIVLDHCDGHRTVTGVIAAVERSLETFGLQQKVIELLAGLGERGVIEVSV
jgi:hypothetical protein